MVRLTQMKWNGTVSQLGMTSIATRFAIEKTTHATKIHRSRFGHRPRSSIETVPHAAHRRDRLGAELGTQPPHVDVHHVGTRIEVIAPDRREQPLLGHGPPGV